MTRDEYLQLPLDDREMISRFVFKLDRTFDLCRGDTLQLEHYKFDVWGKSYDYPKAPGRPATSAFAATHAYMDVDGYVVPLSSEEALIVQLGTPDEHGNRV